jgi:hypothetical protein
MNVKDHVVWWVCTSTHNSIGAPFPVPGRIGNRGNESWGFRGLASSVVKLADSESNLAVQSSPINLIWPRSLIYSDRITAHLP